MFRRVYSGKNFRTNDLRSQFLLAVLLFKVWKVFCFVASLEYTEESKSGTTYCETYEFQCACDVGHASLLKGTFCHSPVPPAYNATTFWQDKNWWQAKFWVFDCLNFSAHPSFVWWSNMLPTFKVSMVLLFSLAVRTRVFVEGPRGPRASSFSSRVQSVGPL